jgi:type I restriction enzyme, S subunit
MTNFIKLKELTSYIGRGITPSYTNEDGVLVLNQKCVRNCKVSFNDARKTNPSIRRIPEDKLLKSFDILVNSTGVGTLGRTAQIKNVSDKVTVDSHVTIVRPDDRKVNSSFLGFALRLLQPMIELLAEGSTGQTELSKHKLGDLDIPFPPIQEQKAIAKILSSLDDKIELNRQMNTTLEAMAQALFKAWFVDFEPVRANMENRPAESASPEIAKLFPSEFENGIPKGWKLSSIGDEVEAVGGGTPSTKEPSYWNGEYNWVTPKDLSNLTDKILISSERTVTAEGLAKISSGKLPLETVLLSSRAPVGYLAIAKIPVAINQGFIAMKCNKLLPSTYVLQWAEHSMDKIKNRASGTTFAEISKANFRPLPVIVPSKIVIEKYDGICRLLYDQITTNAKENETLSQIREELLPKLIKGKIRVPNLQNNYV